MTTSEKRTAIQNYLRLKSFTVTRENDEFTGHKSLFIQSKTDIMFSDDDSVDTGFKDIQESVKDFLRAKVDMSFEDACKNLSPSEKQLFLSTTDIEKYYDDEINRIRKSAVTRSVIRGTLGYSEDSDEVEHPILLNVYFSNVSHHRNVKDMKIYFKKNNGETCSLSNIFAISPVDDKTNLYDYTKEIEYRDYVHFSLSESDMKFLTDCPHFSARFDGMQINGELFLTKEKIDYLKFLISPEEASEEQVDVLYESVQKEKELEKELEEKRNARQKVEKYIEKLKGLDFNRFDYAKLVASNSDKLPHIKEIKKICKENELQSSLVDFLGSISKKYDTRFIINDIDEKSQRKAHYNVVKKVMNILGWIMVILLFVFSSEGSDAGMAITIILGILFFVLKKVFKSKDVYFHEKTSQLIEDFKKALDTSGFDFDV